MARTGSAAASCPAPGRVAPRGEPDEALYRSLIDNQTELVSLATPDGELTFVNLAYARWHGMRPDEMVGRNLLEFVPAADRGAVGEHLEMVCKLRRGVESENQVKMPNGETRRVAWTNRALFSPSGKATAIHSVGRDIEWRVVAERRVRESEARYRLLAENSTDMILLVRCDGRRTYASPGCRNLLGYEPEEMLDIATGDSIHPDDTANILQRLAHLKEESETLVYRMRRKDGRYVWVEGRARAVAGNPPQRLLVVRDIEERIAAEQRLKESEARHRLLAEFGADMIIQLDRDLVRRYVSPACREILGYEPEELVGIAPTSMAHPDDAPGLAAVFHSLLDGGVDRHCLVSRIRHRDGRWIWVESELKTLRHAQTGAPIGIVGALRDCSARKAIQDQLAEANQRLEALAQQDGLTGLANRRGFDEALAREHARARRDGSALALVMIDVDHFKSFNDRFGHPAGDECLKRISGVIATAIRRPGDLAARYGGEEFVVLLPGANEAGAAMIAERIRGAVLRLSIPGGGAPGSVASISAGVASISGNACEAGGDALLRRADQALYRAKEAGRNRVMRSAVARRNGGSPLPKADGRG